jgi:hypothetical protein
VEIERYGSLSNYPSDDRKRGSGYMVVG